MPIDNDILLAFANETVRTGGNLLSSVLPLPLAALDAAVGKGLVEVLGTTRAALFRREPWTDEDYAAIPVEEVTGSGSSGRTVLTNHDVIGFLRIMVALRGLMAQNPALGPLVAKLAVNPRPINLGV